ncbi:MAG: T9SS type A sorting domain-containing protein [Bacteroidetes bacterium]|nr:T9SS type A sorting domain-containing protein [Bacteroidota bacterium]
MLRITAYLFFLIIFNLNQGYTQWLPLNSGTNKNLNDVFFVNDDLGYVVGDSGIILKTVDGGIVWNILSSGTFLNLNGVHFVNADTGFVVGGRTDKLFFLGGIVLKTIDGGNNWISILADTSEYGFPDVHFLNGDTGFVISNVYIIKTIDGGLNWDTTYGYAFPTSLWLYSIYCISDQVGFAAGERGMSTESIVKTTNSGNNWFDLNFPKYKVFTTYFWDQSIGYAGGETYIANTTDGGNSWAVNNLPYFIYSVFAVNSNIAFASGIRSANDSAIIVKTTDGGVNWLPQNILVDSNTIIAKVLSLYFTKIDTGYAVGTNGLILKTTNGGETGFDEKSFYSEYFINTYPNPFSTFTTIEIPEGYKNGKKLSFGLYNLMGREVKRIEEITSDKIKINRDNLSPGLYFYKLEERDQIIATGKVVIQ